MCAETYDDWLNSNIIGKQSKGKWTTMVAIAHTRRDTNGHTYRMIKSAVIDNKTGECLRYEEIPLDKALDLYMKKKAMKELKILVPIRPTPKIYRHSGKRIFKDPATARYENYITLYVKRAVIRSGWLSCENLKIVFEFYFATKLKELWGKLKKTRADSTNLQKSTEDAVAKIIGDDAKFAHIESKKLFAKENKVIIRLINKDYSEA